MCYMAACGGDDVARFAGIFGGFVGASSGRDGGRQRRGNGFVGVWESYSGGERDEWRDCEGYLGKEWVGAYA